MKLKILVVRIVEKNGNSNKAVIHSEIAVFSVN